MNGFVHPFISTRDRLSDRVEDLLKLAANTLCEAVTSFSADIMPGPGREWALVMSAQSAMLYIPPAYCCFTVAPISANFLSTQMAL